jgi:hypothetical protein
MLLVRCNHGFEIINLDNLGRSDHLPKFEKPEYKFIRSYPDSKPLDVFRCKDNFLVCYNRFAFLMSTHGDHIKHKYKK